MGLFSRAMLVYQRVVGHLVATHGSVFGRVVFLNFLVSAIRFWICTAHAAVQQVWSAADLGLGLIGVLRFGMRRDWRVPFITGRHPNHTPESYLSTLWKRFSIRISPLPTNSYDDLHLSTPHLSTLWKRSFQLGSPLLLQIPMTICIRLLFGRGVFN